MAWTQKYYTSDLHFGHEGMLTMCAGSRGMFSSVEEMDQKMIENINARVGKDDILYINGDFAISKNENYIKRCFHALNGRKVLVIGNHDIDDKGDLKPVLAALPWDQKPAWNVLTSDEGTPVYLAHYAHRSYPKHFKGGWHFYGDAHGRLAPWQRTRDVGIDCDDVGFGPLTFRELTARYQPETGEWA